MEIQNAVQKWKKLTPLKKRELLKGLNKETAHADELIQVNPKEFDDQAINPATSTTTHMVDKKY